jgi:lipopolysaccharide transport system ATP-binding protein
MKPIIEVNHLTKEYQLGHITSLKENVFNIFKRLVRKPIQQRENFKALDDVNFTIEKGEVVGIIGHNGAGKSTLLKHLANISKPTKGKVIVRGSVAPLIEVGAGVNPELTGRENIFLNSAILGIPKKIIQQKLDEIIDFSELEQFIDTPVKRYSSGMTVKLGFSIATSMEADILIVDEVLAVGDLAFQRKCFDRMEDIIRDQGRTVLLVSHNIRQVERICNRVLYLKNGKIALDSNTSETCQLFYKDSNQKILENAEKAHHSNIQKTDEIDLIEIRLIDSEDKDIKEIKSGAVLTIRIKFRLNRPFDSLELVVGTHRTDFLYLTAATSLKHFPDASYKEGVHEIEYNISHFPLSAGTYSVRFVVLDSNRRIIFNGESLQTFFINPEPGIRLNSSWNILNLESTLRLIN